MFVKVVTVLCVGYCMMCAYMKCWTFCVKIPSLFFQDPFINMQAFVYNART